MVFQVEVLIHKSSDDIRGQRQMIAIEILSEKKYSTNGIYTYTATIKHR